MSNQQDVKAAQHTAQVVKVIGAGIIALGQSMFRKTLG